VFARAAVTDLSSAALANLVAHDLLTAPPEVS